MNAPNAPAPPLHPPATRRPWMPLLLCLVIFGAGAVVGGGTALIVVGKRLQRTIQEPELIHARLAETLQRRFDLDPAQAARLRGILQQRQAKLAGIREDNLSRLRPALMELEDDVASVMTPDQARRWRERFTRMRRDWLPQRPRR